MSRLDVFIKILIPFLIAISLIGMVLGGKTRQNAIDVAFTPAHYDWMITQSPSGDVLLFSDSYPDTVQLCVSGHRCITLGELRARVKNGTR